MINEALGRIEGKVDAMAGDVRWLMQNTGRDTGEKTRELLSEISKLQKQLGDIRDPVVQFANYKRRVTAIIAGCASVAAFVWAFAEPFYRLAVEHLTYVR